MKALIGYDSMLVSVDDQLPQQRKKEDEKY